MVYVPIKCPICKSKDVKKHGKDPKVNKDTCVKIQIAPKKCFWMNTHTKGVCQKTN